MIRIEKFLQTAEVMIMKVLYEAGCHGADNHILISHSPLPDLVRELCLLETVRIKAEARIDGELQAKIVGEINIDDTATFVLEHLGSHLDRGKILMKYETFAYYNNQAEKLGPAIPSFDCLKNMMRLLYHDQVHEEYLKKQKSEPVPEFGVFWPNLKAA